MSVRKNGASRGRGQILVPNAECIYCGGLNPTVEHMPPKSMFRGKDRPSGLEFPACITCNNGTSAADALLAFISRLDISADPLSAWKLVEAQKYALSLNGLGPDVYEEMFGSTSQSGFVNFNGVLVSKVKLTAGPVTRGLLSVFAAKLGMALFFECTGRRLKSSGKVYFQYFMNAGLSDIDREVILQGLPIYGTLKQGKKSASDQFEYRCNTDGKGVVLAMTHFHHNVEFLTLAVDEPEIMVGLKGVSRMQNTGPGELLRLMPLPRGGMLRF